MDLGNRECHMSGCFVGEDLHGFGKIHSWPRCLQVVISGRSGGGFRM